MAHQVVGYIRVSSSGQNTARQLADIKLDKEFVDMATGSNLDRTALAECVAYMREGDTLVVDSIDRLARNLQDLQEIINQLIKKGVRVHFVKENLLFNGNSDPMSTLMLHMMGAFAEFERSMIRARQREGIDAAKKAGKHLGRPFVIAPKVTKEAKELKAEGLSVSKIALKLNISRATISKMLKK